MNKLLRTLAIILSTFCCMEMWGEEVVLQYKTYDTTKMKEGNNATVLGLDENEWNVTANKGGHTSYPGLNKEGYIALYYNEAGSNSITISNLKDAIIEKISISFYNNSNYNKIQVNTEQGSISSKNNIYEINKSSFTIRNAYTENYQVRIKSITISYSISNKENTTLTFGGEGNDAQYTIIDNVPFNGYPAILEPYIANANIEYVSTNPDIATVNNQGQVSLSGKNGRTVIKATFSGNEEYAPSSAQYTLTVIKYVALVAKHGEKYYALSSKDLSSIVVPLINNKVVVDLNTDYSHLLWNITEQNNKYQIKNPLNRYLAPADTRLSLQNEAFEWEYNDSYHWYNGDNGAEKTFFHSNHYGFVYYSVTVLRNDTYSDATCSYPFTDGYTRPISINGEGYKWGTICMPNAVNAGDFAGATFYSIVGKESVDNTVTSLVLKEEDNLVAGMPYIFKATANIVAAYTGESVSEPTNNNGLYGVLSGTKTISEEEGYYGVANNKVNPLGAGATIPANRAYIRMNEVPEYTENTAEAKVIRFDMNEATNIISTTMDDEEIYFNLKGQRVIEPKNGIYIKNGKKVLIK